MAERVVVAAIDFDETGAVRSINHMIDASDAMRGRVGGAANVIQDQWSRSGAVFVRQMFNMRAAAVAFLGGFTLAGAISQLGNLVQSLITGTDWWKRFKEAAVDTFNSLIKGETAFEATSRKIQELTQGSGVTPTLAVVEQMRNLLKAREEAAGELFRLNMGSGAGGFENMAAWTARVNALTLDLNHLDAALAELAKKAGLPTAQLNELLGVILKFPEPVHKTTIWLEQWEKAVAQVVVESNQLSQISPNIAALIAEQNKGVDVTKEWEAALELLNAQMDALANPKRFALLGTLKEMFTKLSETLTVASLKFDLILAAVNQFASQVATAITEGGVTIRSFVADMLKMVGQMLLAWGALAVITTYFTGYPGYGPAYAAIAAGVAALLASRAIGGGREGMGNGGGAAAQASGGAGSSSLVVNFAGPTFGFNEASFARYLMDLQRRGERGNG